MSNSPDHARREECRRDALAWLAMRPNLKFPADVVFTGLRRQGHDYTSEEVATALRFLAEFELPGVGKPGVNATTGDLGSRLYFGINASGTLYHERNS